jgi:Flp pilus assembly CpaE family ATPase
VALETGIADRLSLVVNRANSGVSVADMERTVGMPALALIRSGGLLLVKAANAGRTVIEMYPKERISDDFNGLAERLVLPGAAAAAVDRAPGGAAAARAALRLLTRAKDPARA